MSETQDQTQEQAENTAEVTPQDVDVQACLHDALSGNGRESGSDELAALKAELDAEKDKRLRAFAELENFKKRKEQEVDSSKKYAAEKVVIAFLPILDDLERAIDSIPAEQANLVSGLALVMKQCNATLTRLDVTEIEAEGKPFNPHCHQAVMQETKEGVASGTVTKAVQKGYMLKDRVIRPAMVVVAQ